MRAKISESRVYTFLEQRILPFSQHALGVAYSHDTGVGFGPASGSFDQLA